MSACRRVLGIIINADGYLELVFLRVANQNKRYASGLMDAVNDTLQDTFGDPKIIYEKVSSICTDGTNTNKFADTFWRSGEIKRLESTSNENLVRDSSSRTCLESYSREVYIGKVLSVMSSILSYSFIPPLCVDLSCKKLHRKTE